MSTQPEQHYAVSLEALEVALSQFGDLRSSDLAMLPIGVVRDARWALDEALYLIRGLRGDLSFADDDIKALVNEVKELEEMSFELEQENAALHDKMAEAYGA